MKIKKIPSIREIKRQSPGKLRYDPFTYLPRCIAPYITKVLCYTPVTANQISFTLYSLFILAIFLVAINKYFIFALVLLHIVLFLDFLDGRIARAKKQMTFLGLYFEYVFHETVAPSLLFALGSYLFITLNNPIYLYFGGIIVIAQLVINSYGTSKQRIMYHHIRKTGKVPPNLCDGTSLLKEAKKKFSVIILRFANLIPNVDVLVYMITVGYIFNFLQYVLTFYFIYFVIIALFKVIIELLIGFKRYGLK